MALDGSLSDRKLNGFLARPATIDFAGKNFPRLIVDIAIGKISQISSLGVINGREILITRSINGKPLYVLREDFDVCKKVASKLDVPLFSSDQTRDYLNRARGMVVEELELLGRPKG